MTKPMSVSLHIPNSIAALREKAKSPYDLGVACGELLEAIPILVSNHLIQPSDFRKKIPKASIDTKEFTAAIGCYPQQMRDLGKESEAFLDLFTVDRNQGRPLKNAQAKYTKQLKKLYKAQLADQLKDIFLGYDVDSTRKFNKGVDFALTGIAWRLYPATNVVYGSGKEQWSLWLRGHCEVLGKVTLSREMGAFDN